MWYEINVSKDGKHLFATNERSLRHISEVIPALDAIQRGCPEDEGYKVTVSRWDTSGRGEEINILREEYARWLSPIRARS